MTYNFSSQTGSGKTHTICGGETFEDRGLIPRTIGFLFSEMQYRQSHENVSFKCLMSFCEVLSESVYDLLDPQKRFHRIEEWPKVQVIENEDGIILKNISVFEVNSEEEGLNLFFMGITNR